MRWISRTAFALLLLNSTFTEASWTRFRGPNGSGVSVSDAPLPATIGPDHNVLWKSTVAPGRSSPVVSNGRIYLTGIRDDNQPVTMSFDQSTGELVWEVAAPNLELTPPAFGGGHAQVTCAATEDGVISLFGSSGLLCYDREGELLWRKQFGSLNTQYGVASSPVVVGDRVIVNQDLDTGSFLIAVRLSDGETIWEVARPAFVANFVTPVIWNHSGQQQVIVPGSLMVIGYDLATGAQVWHINGVSWSVVSTPVFGEDGVLYVNAKAPGEIDGAIPMKPFDQALSESDRNDSGTFDKDEFQDFGPRAGFFPTLDRNKDAEITREEYEYVDNLWTNSQDVLMAIRPGGTGDVTESHVIWKYNRSLPFCPSPIFHEGHIYTVKDLGVVNCLVAETGKRTARERRITSRGEYYSSPVLGDGKIYIASERGELSVITAEPDWKEISHVKFDEDIYATPAIVDGRIFVRTTDTLYCFGFADLEIARTERVATAAADDRNATRVRLAIGLLASVCVLGLFGLFRWFSLAGGGLRKSNETEQVP